MRRLHSVWTVVVQTGLSSALNAFDSTEKSALFYSGRKSGKRQWVGVRTTLQVRSQSPSRCESAEIGKDYRFRPSDRFRFRVQTNVSGYLYLVSRNSHGGATLLHPNVGSANAISRSSRFETTRVPRAGWLSFDTENGLERAYLFLSSKPIQQLESLVIDSSRPISDKDLTKLVRPADRPRSRVMTETIAEGDTTATYALSHTEWSNTYVVQTLTHRH